MKKYLSVIILLFIAKTYSQQYVPLLQEGNKWYELNIEFNFDMPSPLSKTYIVINGEETKNGIVYKKLFSNLYCYTSDKFFPCSATGNTDIFYKLLREDINERKVYFYDEITNSDFLLYDFSLNVGDIIPSNFPFYAQNSNGNPPNNLNVMKIVKNGQAFNRSISKTFFTDDISDGNSNLYPNIFEGIGSNIGLLYRPGQKMFEGGHFLECFENIASGKSCDSNFLSSKDIFNPKEFALIYFKDRNSYKIIGKSSEKFQLQIYDFSGKLLETKSVTSNEEFNMNNSSKSATFMYKLTSSTGVFTGKIIIP